MTACTEEPITLSGLGVCIRLTSHGLHNAHHTNDYLLYIVQNTYYRHGQKYYDGVKK